MKRNIQMNRLSANYLFPEVNMRKNEFLAKHPEASLISLGIGDTTQPIPPFIIQAFVAGSHALGSVETYSGYGAEQGSKVLREKIASVLYKNLVQPDEVFVSDGAKCDLGRLQALFGSEATIAVQDPAYPVYIDGSLIHGVKEIVPMPCHPENEFFPDLVRLPQTDLIYFCSPNNPTGAAATRAQLEQLVQAAARNRSIVIFDSAYAHYIQDPTLPKSIYEIEGARQVAIEVGSFSKLAGFTGVRLGWTIVPHELKYEEGSSVRADWNRLTCTLFNGASNIAQVGGIAVLEERGLQEIALLTAYYLENAKILKEALQQLGYEVFGGGNAPYLWVRFKGRDSWEVFQHFLQQYHLVTTPGSGFGPTGNGFLRLTAFGSRESVLQAVERIK
jgi:LL-diaminopimelate aminotransferase